jgi:hypothetical protein
MKITVPQAKPRNPLVAAARFRQAGKHRASRGSERQRERSALRHQLQDLHPPSP